MRIPESIGRFHVLRALGQGAFGTVFLAEDPDLDRQVALKVPLTTRFATESDIDRFISEARNAARLKHPGIVSVYDVFRDGDGVVVVLEYVEGNTLGDRLRSERPSLEQTVFLIAEIARTLDHAHREGVVHRDLKPDNILLTTEERPIVADFGLAVREVDQRYHKGEASGTPRYMAPEQVRGEAHLLDGRADIWSLGVMLYNMLTDRMPFTGERTTEVFEEIQRREPKPPRQIDPSIPKELERICLKCLAKSPADRYSTAGDLAEDLENWQTQTTQAIPSTPRRRWPMVAAVVTAMVVVVGFLSLWLAGVFVRVETPEGTIELEVAEPGVVFVNGERELEVTTAGDRKFRISVPPGEHRLSIKSKDGIEMFAEEFSVRSGETTILKATYQRKKKEAPPPKRDLPDDPNILTVAQDGSAQFKSLTQALDKAKAGMTIRVVDDKEYEESITLSSRSRHAGLTLEATHGATLVATRPGRLLTLIGVSEVTIRGFTMRAEAFPCFLCLAAEDCSGVVIEDIHFVGDPSQYSIGVSVESMWGDTEKPPLIVRRCHFDRLYTGFRVGAVENDYKTPTPCRRMIVAENTFTNNFQAIRISGEFRDLALVGNQVMFAQTSGIQLEQMLPGTKNVLIANNTMFDCVGPFRLWDSKVRGENIHLVNNLTLESGNTDWLFLDSGGDPMKPKGPGDGTAIQKEWRVGHNWREITMPSDGQIPPALIVPAPTDVLKKTIDVQSRDRESKEFLQPAKNSPLADGGKGGNLPKYVGAIPPPGVKAWDWSKALPAEID